MSSSCYFCSHHPVPLDGLLDPLSTHSALSTYFCLCADLFSFFTSSISCAMPVSRQCYNTHLLAPFWILNPFFFVESLLCTLLFTRGWYVFFYSSSSRLLCNTNNFHKAYQAVNLMHLPIAKQINNTTSTSSYFWEVRCIPTLDPLATHLTTSTNIGSKNRQEERILSRWTETGWQWKASLAGGRIYDIQGRAMFRVDKCYCLKV